MGPLFAVSFIPVVLILGSSTYGHSHRSEKRTQEYAEKLDKAAQLAEQVSKLIATYQCLNSSHNSRPLLGLADSLSEDLSAIVDDLQSVLPHNAQQCENASASTGAAGTDIGSQHTHNSHSQKAVDKFSALVTNLTSRSYGKEEPLTYAQFLTQKNVVLDGVKLFLDHLIIGGRPFDRNYHLQQPLAHDDTVILDQMTHRLDTVELVEWFSPRALLTTSHYPIIDTKEVVTGIQDVFLTAVERVLVRARSVKDEDWRTRHDTDDLMRLREVLRNLLAGLIRGHSPNVHERKLLGTQFLIEILMGQVTKFLYCTNPDGSLAHHDCNYIPSRIYFLTLGHAHHHHGREPLAYLGRLLLKQLRALIAVLDKVGFSHWYWDIEREQLDQHTLAKSGAQLPLLSELKSKEISMEKLVDRLDGN